MNLTQDQRVALHRMEGWWRAGAASPFLLHGYAGTGKTTLVKEAVAMLGIPADRVAYAAPTGKAADVLSGKVGARARTIHSLLYVPVTRELDKLVEALEAETDDARRRKLKREIAEAQANLSFAPSGSGLDADLLVIDEASMVPDAVADDLRAVGVPLLLIGDPGQLPPPRAAASLAKRPPDAMLERVVRHDNGVLEAATAVRRGDPLPASGNGFHLARRGELTPDDILGFDVVLVGTHRTRYATTRRLRQHRGLESRLPVQGEPVLCRKNNRRLGLHNGMMARAASDAHPVGRDAIELAVETERSLIDLTVSTHRFEQVYNRGVTVFSRRGLEEFDYGYAVTVHAAQGSEWDRVAVVDDWRGSHRREWLYTALTRARSELTLIET